MVNLTRIKHGKFPKYYDQDCYHYSEKHLPRNVSGIEVTARKVVKAHEGQLGVNSNATITNQRLDQLSKMIDKKHKKPDRS